MGALPEIVEDNLTGLLFDAGNADALADSVDFLWFDGRTAQAMGAAGREKVSREYAREVYYKRLMDVYAFAEGERARTSTPQAANLAQTA
jgi:glycosyltransferase involved in cell wall biosynthesis